MLCRNHHKAMDAGMFAFENSTGRVVADSTGPDLGALMVTTMVLRQPWPHLDALAWRLENLKQ